MSDSKLLEEIKRLLQQLIAIQLYQSGMTQKDISKNLRLATAKVNDMLKGVIKPLGK